jgi:branched-chain amino acid transport system substrate-binding protein
MKPRPVPAAAAVIIAAATLAACSSAAGAPGSAASGGSAPVVIGTSLSLTGPLGALGTLEEAGYKQAVSDVNAAGGLEVAGTKHKVTLIILDNQSNPTLASQQSTELILKDGAVATLSGCTPTITVPEALVAEQNRVPFVANCTPVEAFAAANPSGWKYSWDLFFDEKNEAAMTAQAIGLHATDKKVALFTDTEPDGVVERPLYKAAVQAAGFTVVGDYTFPVGTTDFSAFINNARSKGAQIVIAQTDPADGIALWKQMKALSFAPEIAFSAKGAATGAFAAALGPVSEGTLTLAFWSPNEGLPESAQIQSTLGASLKQPDLGISVVALSAAQVLFDAITSAGSTSASKVNSALAATDKAFPIGLIKFAANHTSQTNLYVAQWQHGTVVQLVPAAHGDPASFEFPDPGLAG